MMPMLILTCTIMAVVGYLEGISDRLMWECRIRWWIRMLCFMIALVIGTALCCGLAVYLEAR